MNSMVTMIAATIVGCGIASAIVAAAAVVTTENVGPQPTGTLIGAPTTND